MTEPLVVEIRRLIGCDFYEATIGSVRVTAPTRAELVAKVEQVVADMPDDEEPTP